MLYIGDKKYKILVVSTSDGVVRGWRYHQGAFVRATQPDNDEELFEHSFSSEIYCLAWDGINEILYCGQKNGDISMWNLKTDLEKPL
jgi:WD40 repeat protein